MKTHIRDDGKRFVVRADERLIAFMELERAVSSRLALRDPYDSGQKRKQRRVSCPPETG